MMSARARSAAAALLLVAVEANVKDKFWGFLEDVSNEKRERSDVTTIAELLDQGAGVHVESCGGKSDVMTVSHADFIRASLQVRAYGSLSRNVSGGTLHVKMYKGSAAKGSSTEDWLKREMAWHSVPHAYEEDLCKHFSKSHSRRACPLPAGDTELRLALDKLPPMVVAGAYKLKIKATDEAGKSVACLRAQVDVPRGKSGELFRRVEALPTAPSGRTLSAHGQCMCGPSDPVCGDDGRTYAGACEAGCANVGVAYPGSCAGPARLGERELDRRTSGEAAVDETTTMADERRLMDTTMMDCADSPDGWTSGGGSTCSDYESYLWCTASGGYGTGWLDSWGTFANYSADGVDASQACCDCGGGTTTTCEDNDDWAVAASNSTVADCSDAAAQGYCAYDPVPEYCCESCSGEATTTMPEACEDSYSDCPSWTMNDECEYDWYQENCAMSCGKCTAGTTEAVVDYAPVDGVYIVEGFSQAGCPRSSQYYVYAFTKSATTSDCYFYTNPAGEWIGNITGWGSFYMKCDGDTVYYNDYSGMDCDGTLLASGSHPWSMLTSATCTEFDGNNQSLWGDVLATSDYPSTCGASTTESSCPATCYGRTCDEYVGYGYTCDYLESSWGCDCSGCDCAASTSAPTAECVCTEEYDPVCVYGYYDYENTCYAECDGTDYGYWNWDDLEYGTDYVYGTCSDEECVCTEEYDPVCLYDYYSYQNTCYAECDDFYVDYIDSDDWYYGTCSDVSGVAPRGLALLFSLSLAALPQ